MAPLARNKLVGSKWTAVAPVGREKHFLVLRWLETAPGARPEWLEMEAVYTGRRFTLPWRELKDGTRWRQGWLRDGEPPGDQGPGGTAG